MRVPASVVVVAAVLSFASTAAQSPTKDQVKGAIAKAQADPSGLEAYLAVVPRDGDYYVVEGDLLRTRDEIAENFEQLRKTKARAQSKELTVNLTSSGGLDIWPRGQRQLTYSIDRSSFSTPARAKEALTRTQLASAEWQKICGAKCGVTFTFKEDPTPTTTEVTFVIREVDSRGRYVAAAFFPSVAPVRRYLNIDRTYHNLTSPGLRQGVIRHELGHVLGYRHEHIHGIPGCYPEDGVWKQVTVYDPTSVMHYHCGGGGTRELELSNVDITGHTDTYSR